jgi:hypothetical protein
MVQNFQMLELMVAEQKLEIVVVEMVVGHHLIR